MAQDYSKLGIAEFLKEASKQEGRTGKIAFLKEHGNAAIKTVLGYTYDPNIKWLLPEGDPPYTPQPKEADLQHVMKATLRKLNVFVNHNDYLNVKDIKRETLFIEYLETLDPDDAKLLLLMKERNLVSKFKGITKHAVAQAFPGISGHWETTDE